MAIASDRAAIESTPPEGELALLRERLKELEQERSQLDQERQAQAQRIEQLLDYIALLKRKRFAPSSERWSPEQLGLFDEAELEAVIAELEPEPAPNPPAAPPSPAAPAKAAPVRRPLPAHLPRVARLIELSAEAQAALGEGWGCIGYDRSEQLAIIPRQPYVIRTLRAKYAPLDPTAEGGVVIAPRPAQILPKAIAHSSLLAEIVVAKYADALPLYRQEALFARAWPGGSSPWARSSPR
jgi:transposase